MTDIKTATLDGLSSVHLAQLVRMAQLLIDKQLMTKKEAEITLQRIASENELSPIYL